MCYGKVQSQQLHVEGNGSLFVFKLIFKWKTIIFASGHINNTRKIRNDMFPLDENSQSKSISPRARTFGDPFTFSCSNYQEIHTRSQHPNLKILNNTLQGFHIGKEYRKKDQKMLLKNSI